MTTDGELQRRADAKARQDAITACRFCDDHGWINGRRRDPATGNTLAAVVRCNHTDGTLPPGFIPDRN